MSLQVVHANKGKIMHMCKVASSLQTNAEAHGQPRSARRCYASKCAEPSNRRQDFLCLAQQHRQIFFMIAHS